MIRHIAGVAEIVDDIGAGVQFYREVPGVLHFGFWFRRAVAEATFGDPGQADRILLGFSVGFEVEGVEGAHRTIASRSWPMTQPPRQEPGGQTTSRFRSRAARCARCPRPRGRGIPCRPCAGGNGGAGPAAASRQTTPVRDRDARSTGERSD